MEQCRHFSKKALDKNLPPAFLNFSNGALDNLDSWHWVSLMKAEDIEGHRSAPYWTKAMKGRSISLWHGTTRFGGGLVVLIPK